METAQISLGYLLDEYTTFVEEAQKYSTDEESNFQKLQKLLVKEANWSERGAEHVVKLAKKYGAFMLRNALALAVALKIEDGDLGF
jgi:hypothetical protein